MALRFVAIEKEAPFQGKTERWSNVYCYDTAANDLVAYQALCDAVKNAEKAVTAAAVTFKRGRVYTTSGLNGVLDSGNMYFVTEYNEVGAQGAGTNLPYRECCFLVKWPLPRKVGLLGQLGRQRSLKKWLHPCCSMQMSTSQCEGTTVLGASQTGPLATYASAVQVPVAGSQLVSPDGTLPNAAAVVHPYLEHRQFPRGRKE